MYFYVDESGHTGLNIFDSDQPRLYYGVLSSRYDLDKVAEPILIHLRKILDVERLHASELRDEKLIKIIPVIRQLAFDYDIAFDFYTVDKPDYAIIQFFDQTFDQGINPALSWSSYWTPLRYVLLLKLAYLFDRDMAKEAWKARITTNDRIAQKHLINVCKKVLSNVQKLPDARSRELIGDGMRWVISNPSKINYNINSKKDSLQISPNLIGFQSVLQGIASRLKGSNAEAKALIVDQQSQFNNAQRFIYDFYKNQKGVYPLGALGMPVMDLRNMPEIPMACVSGTESAGLELVDLYLWILKRLSENKFVTPQLKQLLNDQYSRSLFDDISLKSIENRWSHYFDNELPQLEEMSAESLAKGKELFVEDELRRKKFLSS
ncbi:DUF3800 domain-containing protein [Psychrobacter glaciei]|uniref:DUF3800 domain-containing protein n=1 Tax=Psychrobacter glaciei TaxID=619771 RepID=UPI003F46BC09